MTHLASQGCINTERPFDAVVLARRGNSILDGKRHHNGQVERRLAHALGRVDGAPVGRVLEETHAEVDGDVVG